MNDAFSTIVVPLDLQPEHDRAVAIAGHLAAVGHLPISLLTVSSPGMPEEPDQFDLHRAAENRHLDRCSVVVLHDNEPARSIAAHLRTLDSPLVVLASGVRSGLTELVSPDISAQLLSEISCPALMVGPKVPNSWLPAHPQLLACVGPMSRLEIVISPMARWVNTFGSNTPCFVTVVESGLQPSMTEGDRFVKELFASSGIRADWKVLHDDDPVDGLLAFAETRDDAVLVVTSERWLDGSRLHLHSVSRRLAHASTKPVLVVPHAVTGP